MRVRRFRISAELLLLLFTAGPHKCGYSVVEDAIPDDARFINVRHGWPNTIELLVESAEFTEVADGAVIPQFQPQCVCDFSVQAGQA